MVILVINNHMAPLKLKYKMKDNHKINQIFKQQRQTKTKIQC